MAWRVGGGMADAADLKSAGVIPVWVRIPPDLLSVRSSLPYFEVKKSGHTSKALVTALVARHSLGSGFRNPTCPICLERVPSYAPRGSANPAMGARRLRRNNCMKAAEQW